MVRHDSATRQARNGNGNGVFTWLGQVAVRHPWRVIALWIVAAVAVIATSPGLPTTSNESSFLPSSYESIRASDLQDQAFALADNTNATQGSAITEPIRLWTSKITAADLASLVVVPGISFADISTSGRSQPMLFVTFLWIGCFVVK